MGLEVSGALEVFHFVKAISKKVTAKSILK